MPEVSVIMGVHNGGRYLPPTLASVYAQTFTDWELIIVDNGSTDGGLDAALGAQPDPRVRVFRYPQQLSPGGALEVACREARGCYLAVLDSDDLSHPRRLEIQRNYLEQRPEVGLLGTACDLIDGEGRPLGHEQFIGRHEDIVAHLGYQQVLRHSSVMFRRAVLQYAHYRRVMGIAEDQDFFARVAEHARLEVLPAPLCLYRVHPENRSRQSPYCAAGRALVAMLIHRRRHGLPEEQPVWEEKFRAVVADAQNRTGRAYLACARIFTAEGRPDLAALNAWQAMREGARVAGGLYYLRLALQGLGRARSVRGATLRGWLKEPAHQLLRDAGAPDRIQF